MPILDLNFFGKHRSYSLVKVSVSEMIRIRGVFRDLGLIILQIYFLCCGRVGMGREVEHLIHENTQLLETK